MQPVQAALWALALLALALKVHAASRQQVVVGERIEGLQQPQVDLSASAGNVLPSDADLHEIQKVLRYCFRDKWLLRIAFIHASAGELNNERLAWLGDAALTLAASTQLYRRLCNVGTAVLHELQKSQLSHEACAERLDALDLALYMVIGKSQGAQPPTMHMKAELFEAILGAIYVDSGYDFKRVYTWYDEHFPFEPEE